MLKQIVTLSNIVTRVFLYIFYGFPAFFFWAVYFVGMSSYTSILHHREDVLLINFLIITATIAPIIIVELLIQRKRKNLGLSPFRSYNKVAKANSIDIYFCHPTANQIKLGNLSLLNPKRLSNEPSLLDDFAKEIEKETELYHDAVAGIVSPYKYKKETAALFDNITIK